MLKTLTEKQLQLIRGNIDPEFQGLQEKWQFHVRMNDDIDTSMPANIYVGQILIKVTHGTADICLGSAGSIYQVVDFMNCSQSIIIKCIKVLLNDELANAYHDYQKRNLNPHYRSNSAHFAHFAPVLDDEEAAMYILAAI